MSFFKKLSKQKVSFQFYIFVMNMTNLPMHLEGSSLLAQIKRKDKSSQTKYGHVSGGAVTWQQESMAFSTSFWAKSGVYDEKCFTVKIKSMASNKDIMEFDLDLSKFIKENSFMEHVHAIEFPPEFDFDSGVTYAHKNRSAVKSPRMNLVIRSYAEGLNHDRGDDFSQFHDAGNGFKNPLLQNTVSVIVNERLDLKNNKYGQNDEDGLMPDPDAPTMANERRGTRKISVMFNQVTENGHRQSCLPDQPNQPGGGKGSKDQRQSTYRFSIAAGKGVNAPIDSDDDDLTPQRNVFDDEDDPFGDSSPSNHNMRKDRLMSTVNQRQQNTFDIGEDSDYE